MPYNAALHTTTNKAIGIAQASSTDARSYYYDETLFTYRPFATLAEALAYLNTPESRTGHVSFMVGSGATIKEYWFKNGLADGDAEEKIPVLPANIAYKDAANTFTEKQTILNSSGIEQLRLSYDVVNYAFFLVDVAGNLTIRPQGITQFPRPTTFIMSVTGVTEPATENSTKLASTAWVKRELNSHFKDNQSIAAQTFTESVRTYITGTNLKATAGTGLVVGSRFRFEWDVTKTNTGNQTSTIDVCLGAAGTVADTARLTFTKPAGTNSVDTGWYIVDVIVRAAGAATILVGTLKLSTDISNQGFLANSSTFVQTVISASFDSTAVTNIGVCLTTGANEVVTTQVATATAFNVN